MAKTYNSTWQCKSLNVNFNLKQWRQDIGEFIRRNKYWDGTTRVTRSKAVSTKGTSIVAKGVKEFRIYTQYGGEVIIQYQNYNELLYTNEPELVKKYFTSRSLLNN